MKKAAVDRLSELPESLTLQVLSFLETRDAARTSVLSKHWADLWTSVPCLEFIDHHPYSPKNKDESAVGTIIDKVLLRWRGTKILKFKVQIRNTADVSASYGSLDSWFQFATEKKVECLSIRLYGFKQLATYQPPQCLYSCSSITKLALTGINLEVGGINVQWYNLKVLFLQAPGFSEELINQVVSSSPKLEELVLELYIGSNNMNIRSSSLKRLDVCKYNYFYCHAITYAKLTIWAPKLEVLSITGNAYSECSLMDVSSLFRADLDFFEGWEDTVEFRDTLMQILPRIKHVESLALSSCSLQFLGVMLKGKKSFPPFKNLKKLKVWGVAITPDAVVGLAEIFPKVEKLRISEPRLKTSSVAVNYNIVVDEAAIKDIKSFWMQLRRIEVTHHSNKGACAIFDMIDFFSEHALMLQEIVIRKHGNYTEAADEPAAAQLQQRFSPTLHFNTCSNSQRFFPQFNTCSNSKVSVWRRAI